MNMTEVQRFDTRHPADTVAMLPGMIGGIYAVDFFAKNFTDKPERTAAQEHISDLEHNVDSLVVAQQTLAETSLSNETLVAQNVLEDKINVYKAEIQHTKEIMPEQSYLETGGFVIGGVVLILGSMAAANAISYHARKYKHLRKTAVKY